ncbi:hypothetical protein [Terribacillus sp. AE2B 122]|uniref:hypothetical protein n=1 Tax=Terribacillus TaxID=459532 RepID=UPI0020C6949F|nr:hypothetical protein [Terribacillus sp. AE2B 122]
MSMISTEDYFLQLPFYLAGSLADLTELNEVAISILNAFIAGGIVLNVLKEELPEEKESSIGSFLLGAVGYTILLLLV